MSQLLVASLIAVVCGSLGLFERLRIRELRAQQADRRRRLVTGSGPRILPPTA